MKQTRRARIHETIRDEIKNIAWEQIAQYGAAALSLRAIAHQMEVTPSALYRYFANRDELVTSLIVDAFTSLAGALEAARDALPAEDYARRYVAVGMAYRDWAITHPQRYALIFGTPIPGYHAPMEVTQPAAACALGVLMGVLEAGWEAGIFRLSEGYGELTPAIQAQLQEWRETLSLSAPIPVLYLTLVSWSRVHGLISLELYEQFPPMVNEPGEMFRLEVNELLNQLTRIK